MMIDTNKLERLLANVRDARQLEQTRSTCMKEANSLWKNANENLNVQRRILEEYWDEIKRNAVAAPQLA